MSVAQGLILIVLWANLTVTILVVVMARQHRRSHRELNQALGRMVAVVKGGVGIPLTSEDGGRVADQEDAE